MKWLPGLVVAPWFRFVLIGAPIVAGVVFGFGYMKGYGKAEAHYQEAINEALADQLERLAKIHQADLAAAVSATRRVADHAKRIDQIPRPVGDCNSPDWLHTFNDGVRAVNTFTGRTD